MEYKVDVRVETPTGQVATDYEIFGTVTIPDNPASVAALMAEVLGDELISDLFDAEFIFGKELSESEIREIEEREWLDYSENSKVTWTWKEYENDK